MAKFHKVTVRETASEEARRLLMGSKINYAQRRELNGKVYRRYLREMTGDEKNKVAPKSPEEAAIVVQECFDLSPSKLRQILARCYDLNPEDKAKTEVMAMNLARLSYEHSLDAIEQVDNELIKLEEKDDNAPILLEVTETPKGTIAKSVPTREYRLSLLAKKGKFLGDGSGTLREVTPVQKIELHDHKNLVIQMGTKDLMAELKKMEVKNNINDIGNGEIVK